MRFRVSFGSRVDPTLNKCPVSVGRDFRLDETLKLAVNEEIPCGMWGPYEIRKEAFDLGVKRKKLLDGGTIGYKADDRAYSQGSSRDQLFPCDGGAGRTLS